MSKGQRIKARCKMKTRFTREKMLLNQALLPQPLPWRPPLETNESVPPLRKKGREVPFRKKVLLGSL